MNAKILVFVICIEAIIYLVWYYLHDCTFKGFPFKKHEICNEQREKLNHSWNPEHSRTTWKASDTSVSRNPQDFWNLCQWGRHFIVKRLGLDAIGILFDPNNWIYVWYLYSNCPARMSKRNSILLSCVFEDFLTKQDGKTLPLPWNHKNIRGKPIESFLFKTDFIGVRGIKGTSDDFHFLGHHGNYARKTNWM